MPMQVFEFQADSSVSLASTAAINRKSCDHCFLNRKTCDKVRTAADSGEKCKRCAKDDRPCTFTPTVHLYHIADCVGRHQCRAKVIQSMGGRKKEVKFKTIEISIVCDMDSELDQALYENILRQPNLLAYNNRIKSFLAQDMLGLTEEQEDRMSSTHTDQGVPDSTSESPTHGSKRSFEAEVSGIKDEAGNTSLASPTQGPHKFRIMALIDAHQNQNQLQQQQQQLQQQQQPQQNLYQVPHSGNSPGVSPLDTMQFNPPLPSPNTLSPNDAMSTHQRRLSETLAASALPSLTSVGQYGASYQNTVQQQQNPYQQQQHHYAQHNHPQASIYGQQQQFQQQQQMMMQSSYRGSSPMPHSPLGHSPTRHSPQPPSPLELSLSINTNFGNLNSSHQNLPSLFDSTLTMSTQQHQQQQQEQQMPTRTSVGTSTSPQMGSESNLANLPAPPPLVITTTNEDGNEVGFYYAVPNVNLNPAYSDADLFQDFTMMDPLGEDFVWIQNLFDDPTPEEEVANMAAMSVAAAAGSPVNSSPSSTSAPTGADNAASDVTAVGTAMSANDDVSMVSANFGQLSDSGSQQQQSWMNQGYSHTMQG
ncbi:hypothetical protein BGZ58_010647 [Dissophora ornata]|nr:hypothetical protein BGZ58_010647 [Dissophora ornata]